MDYSTKSTIYVVYNRERAAPTKARRPAATDAVLTEAPLDPVGVGDGIGIDMLPEGLGAAETGGAEAPMVCTVSPVALVQAMLLETVAVLLSVRSAHYHDR